MHRIGYCNVISQYFTQDFIVLVPVPSSDLVPVQSIQNQCCFSRGLTLSPFVRVIYTLHCTTAALFTILGMFHNRGTMSSHGHFVGKKNYNFSLLISKDMLDRVNKMHLKF